MDREEGELRDLKANLGKKAKRKLERACKGGGWITVLTSSQDGTDIYRESSRDALRLRLDLTLQNPPMACDSFSNLFTVEHACRCKGGGGGLVGLRHNLLNKEWAEMCRAAYTPAAVTKEPKIHGDAEAGEAPRTGGRGGRRRGTRGYPYAE